METGWDRNGDGDGNRWHPVPTDTCILAGLQNKILEFSSDLLLPQLLVDLLKQLSDMWNEPFPSLLAKAPFFLNRDPIPARKGPWRFSQSYHLNRRAGSPATLPLNGQCPPLLLDHFSILDLQASHLIRPSVAS